MNTYTLERQYRLELASIPDAKHLPQQQEEPPEPTEYSSTRSLLPRLECAWCLAEQGIKPTSGSHGICTQHAEQVMQQYWQRRGRS